MIMREVPTFRVQAFREKHARYACAVFVLNENGRLHAQLGRMLPYADLVDIVIADGGSTDGSVGEDLLAPRGVRALLTKTGPGKLSAQMRMAMAWAMDEGYDGLIVIDGNNKDDPAAIPLFTAGLDRGLDHLQGSRFIPGGHAENTPPARLLGIHLLHAPLISLAARTRYTDTTNGFRAYSRRLLLDVRVAPFRDVFSAYELHYYLAIRASRLGFRVEEVPVTRAYPAHGPVPTKISPVRGSIKILRTLMHACLHLYDPPTNRSGTKAHG
ncbi:MAG: glycosyltransferase family 2 protein [Gemmatimonadaceae bacterium]|nr:glycosyltransferase family 2 protein [Gemmatimonadaceae bacterium]